MTSSALLVVVLAAAQNQPPFQPAPSPPGPPPPPPQQPYTPPPGPPPPYPPQPYYYPPPPVPPPAVDRSGFMGGFGIGGGSMGIDDDNCNGCDSLDGLAFEFHLGGMLTPNLALMFEGFGLTHFDEHASTSQSTGAVALQWHFLSRMWARGGVGFGQISVTDDDGDRVAASDDGFALTYAIGVELVQSGSFAFDIAFRGAVVDYDGYGSAIGTFAAGFNWY